MIKIRLFSVFAIAATSSAWTTAAMAGSGGGYTLVCNSVSPTQGCVFEQVEQININVVFEQNVNVNQYNVLDQEILGPSITQQTANQATQQSVNQPQQPYMQPTQQQYASQSMQAEMGNRSLQREIGNRSMQREIGNRSMQMSNQYSMQNNQQYNYNYNYNYNAQPSYQNRQMETGFPVASVKVQDIVDIQSGFSEQGRSEVGYGGPTRYNHGHEGEETIFIDSIVTLLGRL